MAHYDKIPQLLDNLITCSVAEACRRVGITPQTFWNYIVRSKLGDPRFQEVEFCAVIAPLHVQYQNAKTLASQQIEQNAIERARDGCMVDVFYQGQRMFERVKKAEFANTPDEDLWLVAGSDWEEICFELRPTKQWLKPSDALVIRMLESWNKKYRSHQEIDVRYGGVLRLERPDEQTTKTIEHQPQVFEEDDDSAEPPRQLALARPATSSEELDKWAEAGEFAPAPVTFVSAKGERTELRADLERRLAEGPKNPMPLNEHGHRTVPPKPAGTIADDPPDDAPEIAKPDPLLNHPRAYWAPGCTPKPAPRDPGKPRPVQPLDSAGYGPGKPPEGGFKVG